jgi:hypothetical protein
MRWILAIWVATNLLALGASQTEADEAKAIAALERLGAGVERDLTLPGHPAIEVSYVCGPTPDVGLTNLSQLKSLKSLSVSCNISDAGLKIIGASTELRWLGFDSARMLSDSGLASLADLKKLQFLRLKDCRITGVGFKELTGLTDLQTLEMPLTTVTDAGLRDICKLKGIRHLVLCYTNVSLTGVSDVAALSDLLTLDLRSTSTTDLAAR